MSPRHLLARLPLPERRFVAEALREETVGGALVLAATVVAIAWANSPWRAAYDHVRTAHLGPLTVEHWAADGLLAVFFLVAGLELKRELVVGQLRTPSQAVLPIAAALAGMVVPAGLYLAVAGRAAPAGWAVPMATDIAFALAVLAVIGSALPTPLRAFLLTLAVADDLGAITVIAVVYTRDLALLPLGGALALLAAYALLQRLRRATPWLAVPLGVAVWWLVAASGVHATVAGVAVGLLTRVRRDSGESESPAERLEHHVRPLSAGVCVPAFALFAAGIDVSVGSLGGVLRDPAALGVIVGLVAGKTIGVFGGAYLVARWTRAELDPELGWSDLLGVAVLSGIGFTVSLLIAELAFGDDAARLAHVKTGVLAASVLAALLATVLLRARHRHYARLPADGGVTGEDPGYAGVR
ncbi:MAG TPA: Na+/H+ antiporter NhaA [Mycobacteriales bacterium]|nr:Na+/H+ antiporter NhaA [Mycobacteriales bacterium]